MARCPVHKELLVTYGTTLTKMGKSFDCIAGKCPWCSKIYLNIPFFHHYDEVEIQGKTYIYHEQLAREFPTQILENPNQTDTNSCKHFLPGDIINLISINPSLPKEKQKKRIAVSQRNPHKLIVIERIDSEHYLVAIGKRKESKTQLKVNTNRGPMYVITSSFYPIDVHSISGCNNIHFLNSKEEIVESIIKSHSSFILAEKKKQLIEKRKLKAAKKHKKIVDRATQKKLEKNYSLKYEIAVMNNDKKKMRDIESIAGSALYSGRYKTRNGKVLYSSFNPHPSSGGMFTPK